MYNDDFANSKVVEAYWWHIAMDDAAMDIATIDTATAAHKKMYKDDFINAIVDDGTKDSTRIAVVVVDVEGDDDVVEATVDAAREYKGYNYQISNKESYFQ